MSITAEPLATTPETQLAKVATEAGLVGPARQELIDAFLPDFSSAWNLSVQAKDISVTDPGQKDEIRKARDMRLQLREVRIASEKRRKALKEDSLRRGQAIDKVAKVITQIAEPAEAKLLEMETIAERLEQERRSKLRADRVMQLAPYGVDTTCIDLAGMEEPAFARLLQDSRLASEAREKAKREEEEKRAAEEAARKAEAKRLKAEPIRFGHAFAIMTEDFDEDANTGMSFKPGSQGRAVRMSDTDFLDRLDWDKLTSEVVKKIGYLRAASNAADDAEVRNILRRDLVLPNLDLLRRFCEAITEDEE